MHTNQARSEDHGTVPGAASDDDFGNSDLPGVARGFLGLFACAALIYAVMIYLALVPQGEFATVRLGISTSDALTTVALTGATVFAVRSWIRISDRGREPTHNIVRTILFRVNLAMTSGMVALLAGFAANAQSAPDTVEVGGIIALVGAVVVGLLAVDTAQVVPTRLIRQHRRRVLRQDWNNLMRVHDHWSQRHRRRTWRRTVFAVALVRSALVAGFIGFVAFELVESRDGSWNSAADVVGDLAVLALCTLIVLSLMLLALESWALSDWPTLALAGAFLALFLTFLAISCVQTIAAANGTIGWAVSAGFLAAFSTAGAQAWLVCARKRSALLRLLAPTAFCAVIARRALCIMKRREREIDALYRGVMRRPGTLRHQLNAMRGVGSASDFATCLSVTLCGWGGVGSAGWSRLSP